MDAQYTQDFIPNVPRSMDETYLYQPYTQFMPSQYGQSSSDPFASHQINYTDHLGHLGQTAAQPALPELPPATFGGGEAYTYDFTSTPVSIPEGRLGSPVIDLGDLVGDWCQAALAERFGPPSPLVMNEAYIEEGRAYDRAVNAKVLMKMPFGSRGKCAGHG